MGFGEAVHLVIWEAVHLVIAIVLFTVPVSRATAYIEE